MYRLLGWLALSFPVAVFASETNSLSTGHSGWSPAVALPVFDMRSGECRAADAERTTSVYIELKDAAGRHVTDDVEVRVDSVGGARMTCRLALRLEGRPLRLKGVPVPAGALATIALEPRGYERRTVLVALAPPQETRIQETLAVRPTQVRPELPALRELQTEARWAGLWRVLANSGIDEIAWCTLRDEEKAGLLNLYAKMQHETLGGRPIFSFVQRITGVRPERVYAVVADDLLERFLREQPGSRTVSGPLHKLVQRDFPKGWSTIDRDGSFKTNDRVGNLQLTFARDAAGALVADIDIDDHTGIAHAWDVLTHLLTGSETHPYDIHDILVRYQRLDPGYDLVSVAAARSPRRRGLPSCHGVDGGTPRASQAIRPRRPMLDGQEAGVAIAAVAQEPAEL